MRQGWTDKEIARILGVAEAKASQAYMPALTKMAKLFQVDAGRTLRDLAWACESLPATDAEIDLLERMHEGRANHSELGQRCPAASSARMTPCTPHRPCGSSPKPARSFAAARAELERT